MATGTLVSVNVGRPHPYAWRGRTISSGIWKHPVSGPVAVRGTNLVGDEQADLRAHGGPDKAIYAYSTEDYAWWSTQLGRALEPASFGENLTTAGLDLTSSLIGDRWQVGTALLEVAQPRTPCYKLGIRMDDDTFPDRFLEEGRTGAYLRIIHEGELAAGDPIVVIPSRAERLSLGDVARICHAERDRAAELLEIPELAASRHAWARRTLERHSVATPAHPDAGSRPQ
jgi:MOSC domain-containing protein YiiM